MSVNTKPTVKYAENSEFNRGRTQQTVTFESDRQVWTYEHAAVRKVFCQGVTGSGQLTVRRNSSTGTILLQTPVTAGVEKKVQASSGEDYGQVYTELRASNASPERPVQFYIHVEWVN